MRPSEVDECASLVAASSEGFRARCTRLSRHPGPESRLPCCPPRRSIDGPARITHGTLRTARTLKIPPSSSPAELVRAEVRVVVRDRGPSGGRHGVEALVIILIEGDPDRAEVVLQ